MAYDEALAERVRAELQGQPRLEAKKMFGGICFMVAGQMCCGVLKDDLIAKVGSDQFDGLVEQPHVRPFDLSGRPMRGMVYVAGDGVASEDALRAWVERSLDFVAAHPKAAKRPGRRR